MKKTAKKKVASASGHDRSEIVARVQAIRDAVNEKMKKNVFSLLSKDSVEDLPCISTGIPELNKILSGNSEIGGFPRGRIIEIRGKEATAKTSLALIAAAIAQKTGKIVALIDAEHAFDPRYAAKLGVYKYELLYSMPDSGEEGLDSVANLARTEEVDVIIIDSVAALVSASELDKEGTDNRPGVQAKMMSSKLKKIQSTLSPTGPTVIFINQIRTNPMVMFGSKDYSPGGNALAFFASIRLDIRRIKTHSKMSGKKVVNLGFRIRVRTIKNRLVEPFQELELEVIYAKGISVVDTRSKKELKAVEEDD